MPAENNDATYNELIERRFPSFVYRQTPIKSESFGNYLQINDIDIKKSICRFALNS